MSTFPLPQSLPAVGPSTPNAIGESTDSDAVVSTQAATVSDAAVGGAAASDAVITQAGASASDKVP